MSVKERWQAGKVLTSAPLRGQSPVLALVLLPVKGSLKVHTE